MRQIIFACVMLSLAAALGCGGAPTVNKEEAAKKELKELNEARKKEGAVLAK